MNKLSQMKLDGLEKFATSFRADFRFAPLNIMILVVLCLAGLVVHLAVYPFQLETVTTMIFAAIGLAVVFRLLQVWEAVLVFTTAAAFTTYLRHRPEAWVLVATVILRQGGEEVA